MMDKDRESSDSEQVWYSMQAWELLVLTTFTYLTHGLFGETKVSQTLWCRMLAWFNA
jgi:hypothetical protein